MPTISDRVVALNVRVPQSVMGLLDRHIEQARRAGQRVTKESLVADAIRAQYSPDQDWLPVHHATLAGIDEYSNAALLDLLDAMEQQQ